MVKKVFILGALLGFIAFSGAYALEELLFEEFEVVYSAARMAQPIAESPAAITVITSEDIRKSGARNIPEVLRQVVGLNVVQTSAVDYHLSARGFELIPGIKMAFLIDGLPMITYSAYDAAAWELAPVTLEDIERIEVIRGPGSSLYGSNAMLGVINIITRDPAEYPGGRVSASAGELGTYLGSVRYGGSTGDLSYRVGADYRTMDEFGKRVIDGELKSPKALDAAMANLKMDYSLDGDSKLSLLGAYSQGDVTLQYESTGYMQANDFRKADLGLSYMRPSTELTLYMKYIDLDSVRVQGLDNPFTELHTRAELRHTKELGKHTLIGGVEASNTATETGLFTSVPDETEKETLSALAAYLQDDFRVTDSLLLNASLRYDYHDIAEGRLTTRGSAVYLLNDRHNLRFTYGTSYRNPNTIEYFYEFLQEGDVFGTVPPELYQPTVLVSGRDDLDPELAESYELGYRGIISDRLEFLTNVFLMNVEGFVAIMPVGMDPVMVGGAPLIDPATGMPVPETVYMDFVNTGDAESVGAEVEVRYMLTDWLGGFVNYTWVNVYETEFGISERLEATPRNRFNAGLDFNLNHGLSANLFLHYSDETEWPDQWKETLGGGGKSDAYTLVNLRLGYIPPVLDDSLEVSVFAFNLFDEKFSQYPIEHAPLERKVVGTLSYSF